MLLQLTIPPLRKEKHGKQQTLVEWMYDTYGLTEKYM
jgi:hypothetical protein